MAPQPKAQSASNEAKLILAVQALKNDASLSIRHAAALYNSEESRIRRRRAGVASRRDYKANLKNLTKLEEEAIVDFIIKLDSKGFSLTLAAIQDMANTLLAQQDAPIVGQNWPSNFVVRTPSIKTRLSQPYNYRRAKYKDPKVIGR
jgi:hypothetical protein